MSKSFLASTTVTANGRVQLPVAIRKELGLEEGSELIIRVEKGRLIMESPLLAWDKLREVLEPARRKPGEELVSEELIRERREEAVREGY